MRRPDRPSSRFWVSTEVVRFRAGNRLVGQSGRRSRRDHATQCSRRRVALLVSSPGWIHTLWARCFANSSTIDGSVTPFPSHRETAPFPTDVFTVTDQTQNTGRRMSLPSLPVRFVSPTARISMSSTPWTVSDCSPNSRFHSMDRLTLRTRCTSSPTSS